MGADFKRVEEAVATQIEEMQTEVVEDDIVEVAGPEELAPVEDVAEAAASVEVAPVEGDVAEEAAAPIELAPVEDDVADVAAAPLELAPVIEVASPVTVEHEEVEIIEIEDADESMEITPAFEGSGDCLSDTTLSGSLVSPVDESDENHSDAEDEIDDSLLAGSLDSSVEEFDDNDASDAGDEQDDSLLAEKEDEMTEKEEKIAASDMKSTVEEDINVTSH